MENLKLLRSDKGVTQKQVADHLGVARSTYTQYETGASEPDINTIIKIANYFGVSADTLFGVESDEIGSAIKEERVEQGLSIKEVADELQISVKDVLEIETNGLPIEDEELIKKLEVTFGFDWLEKLNKEQEYGLAIANKILSLFSEGDYSLEELDATKFFTGMVLGCNLVFRKLTKEDISTLEFTYKLNQLVVQYLLENKGRCSK